MDKPFLLMLCMAMVIEHVCAQYYGPYGYYFTSTQCGILSTKKGKTVEQCEKICDTLSKCTAFNYHRETLKCSLRSCGSPQPMPIGDKQMGRMVKSEWESWSKEHIKWDNSTLSIPNPSGKQRFTVPPTYRHRYFKAYYHKRHYSDRQCKVVGSWPREKIPRDQHCRYLCNDTPKCTAFNEHVEYGCVLRACGEPQPFPIGEATGTQLYHWSSRSLTEAEYGFTRYFGPYGKYFSYNECLNIKEYNDKSLVECEELCDATPGCTAFNFSPRDYRCQMRKCTSENRWRHPVPSGDVEKFSHYEGWSKEYILTNEIKEPYPRCPSIQCELWEKQDMPSFMKQYLRWTQEDRKKAYCDRIKCFQNPFAYYHCPKCDGYKD